MVRKNIETVGEKLKNMKKPFIEELTELCDRRGYQLQTLCVEGKEIEVSVKKPKFIETKQMTFDEMMERR